MISHTVPARAGLLGNPSDGYGGRTLAVTVPAFGATVEVVASNGFEIVPQPTDLPQWSSAGDLLERVSAEGYGTGPQLLAATVNTFANLLATQIPDDAMDAFRDLSLSLSYRTTIPRQVGLAGSSALIIATLRCLVDVVTGSCPEISEAPIADLCVPDEVLASVALAVETEELGVTAGLQDRVVQTIGGLVAMDFGEMSTNARFGVRHGSYRQVDGSHLPPLFVAYRTSAAEPSDRYHRHLRERYDAGDATVRELLHRLAGLAVEGEAALRWNSPDRFGRLLAENMRLRRQLAPVSDNQLELVEVASDCDAPATFAGSGGAVVGAYGDRQHLADICSAMAARDAEVADLARSH